MLKGAWFVRRVNRIKLVGGLAMGAAMLVCAGDIGATARAQETGAATTQAPAAEQTPAAPAAAAPAAPATAAPAAPVAPATAAPAAPEEAQGGTIRGTVKASGVPLPGVAVTATTTLTGKKYATTTDIDGIYEMEGSEEHTSELQSLRHLVCRLLLEK